MDRPEDHAVMTYDATTIVDILTVHVHVWIDPRIAL
jgi:hypothetical protein